MSSAGGRTAARKLRTIRAAYNPPPMWKPGERVTHRFHSELGTGRIVAVQGRSLKVEFPEAGQELSFAAGTDALVPLAIVPGGRGWLGPTGELVVCQSRAEVR